MADTKISDVIVPEVFNKYVIEKTAELSSFYMGGIITPNGELDALASAGGRLITMPFWSDLTGDDEILSDSGSLTVNPIGSGTDVAVLHARGKAWGVNDLATALSGDDPMGAIASLVAEYWARRYQAVLITSLTGIFADNVANDASDMVADISGATNADVTADTKMSGDAFIDAQATFGDAIGQIAGIAMHSTVYNNLKKIDNISFEKESMGDLEIETYRGLRVIVNDTLPYTPAGGALAGDTAPFYTSYLFGTGAFGFGQGGAPVPTETDRDSLAGTDILINRSHFIMHPRGIKWTDTTVAGQFPTNPETALAVNWDRVYERKNIRIASLVTNG